VRENARVLDAGSGLQSQLTFEPHVHVTGVDISRALLDANSRLNERILADLQEINLPLQSYDCVVCWDVLEHLHEPEHVVDELARAVAPTGFLITSSPNPLSLKGLVTKYTPYYFHLWVYRRFFNPNATKEPGRGPYPTYMKIGGGIRSVVGAAETAGLVSLYLAKSESPMQVALRQRFHIQGKLWSAIQAITWFLSVGKIDAAGSDYLSVFERPLYCSVEKDRSSRGADSDGHNEPPLS
jgi:SAM-dependent methyltransferase